MWNILFNRSFFTICFQYTPQYLSFVYCQKSSQKQISLISAFGHGFFGSITQTKMAAMNKPSDSHSCSEVCDSPQPPPSTSHTKSPHLEPKSSNYQPTIKSKLLSVKNKNIVLRFSPTKHLSPNTSSSYPISNTPPVLESCSPPPPN